ncbi:hypothetical protein HK101_001763 [Irineochytrium annulatum]|nr:hypothetical protein HK101_001763 [Irineochytrium annulatum]
MNKLNIFPQETISIFSIVNHRRPPLDLDELNVLLELIGASASTIAVAHCIGCLAAILSAGFPPPSVQKSCVNALIFCLRNWEYDKRRFSDCRDLLLLLKFDALKLRDEQHVALAEAIGKILALTTDEVRQHLPFLAKCFMKATNRIIFFHHSGASQVSSLLLSTLKKHRRAAQRWLLLLLRTLLYRDQGVNCNVAEEFFDGGGVQVLSHALRGWTGEALENTLRVLIELVKVGAGFKWQLSAKEKQLLMESIEEIAAACKEEADVRALMEAVRVELDIVLERKVQTVPLKPAAEVKVVVIEVPTLQRASTVGGKHLKMQ